MTRQDGQGRAFAGSQLQIQIYVNRRAEELSRAVLQALTPKPPDHAKIRWVSPLEMQKFAEYSDTDFLGMLGLAGLGKQLAAFWPKGGPNWDGLAIVQSGEADFGYLLVEAKRCMRSARAVRLHLIDIALRKIDAALKQTKRWLGVKHDVNWREGLYQTANRLAHLYFLREIAGLEAWLVNLCFTDDPHPHRHTSEAEWRDGLAASKTKLGLPATTPWVSDILLPARPRDELFSGKHPSDAQL